MKRILSTLLLAAMVALYALGLPSVALADVAPPRHPPGSNPGPANQVTQVRMLAETVTIDVTAVDPPLAHVSAFFTMHNLGSSAESMAVKFPIAASDGFDNFPEIKNVSIKVNDRPTPFDRIQGPEPTYGFSGQNVPWASFNVTFPPGEDLPIKVTYDLDGTGYPQETYTSFYYILSTGAGWNGTIGTGEIILRLPYDASAQNVILEGNQAVPRLVGREAHWQFTDLEPTTDNNLTFDIVKPVVWKQVIIELTNTSANPQDGEAYGRLGRAYKQALFAASKGFPRTDPGAAALYQLSKAAYAKAVALKPTDGLWHVGFADLLLTYSYFGPFQNHPYTPDLNLGINELALAYQFAPKDSTVLGFIDQFSSLYPDYIVKKSDGSPDFLSLTQTPTPAPETALPPDTPIPPTPLPLSTQTSAPASQPATLAPIPTQTPPPAVPAQPTAAAITAKPTSKPSTPICGGLALILLPLAFFVWNIRRGRS